jgi:thioesterase domain-containing protein
VPFVTHTVRQKSDFLLRDMKDAAILKGIMALEMEHSSALVDLKLGGSRNFFLVHPGDGDPLFYSSLARHMTSDLAVFGIRPLSIPGVPIAHTRIEDMARFYVDEVRKKQPHGPYFLGGLCAGGVIAYEMSLQLSRAGESVELLALLEAVTPQVPMRRLLTTKRHFSDMLARSRDKGRLAKWSIVVGALRVLAMTFARKIGEQGERWWLHARFCLLHQVLKRRRPWPRYIRELSPMQICESAGARYVPKPLSDTSVILVRAQRRSIIFDDIPYRIAYTDEKLGWGSLIENLTVIDVDGGHSTMLQEPFVGALAAALMRCINDSASPCRTSRVSHP